MSSSNQPWQQVAEFRGHSSWIYGVPITPNGQTLASVSFNKILLWDLTTKELNNIFEGHGDIIFSLAISSDGKFLASGSNDKTVGLWNIETGDLICSLAERQDPIHSVAFSSDSKLLASGGANKYKVSNGKATNIYLWDTQSRKLIRTFSEHSLRINSLAFSSDGKMLASGSNDKTVRLWNVASGEQLYLLEGHSGSISTVTFSPDGKSLFSAGGGGIKVWDVSTGVLQRTLHEDADYIKCFTIDPTGKFFAVELYDGIEIWDLVHEQKVVYLNCRWPVTLAFSPDGSFLASGDATAFDEEGGLVKVWCVPKQDTEFDPETIEDARRRIQAEIVQRQGQSEFRKALLNAYEHRCCITGCDVEAVLEAAHIVPYYGEDTNLIENGLLLRADIHTLFDSHLLSINPNTLEVELKPSLANSQYGEFVGKPVRNPLEKSNAPSSKALQWHYNAFLQK